VVVTGDLEPLLQQRGHLFVTVRGKDGKNSRGLLHADPSLKEQNVKMSFLAENVSVLLGS
jgi:hypothetical protein